MPATPLRLATRASPLAIAQSSEIARQLESLEDGFAVELITFATQGDRILDQPLADIGGKGLFTAELDAALRSGEADLAVHSLKDLPTQNQEGLTIAAIPQRADPRDVLIVRQGVTMGNDKASAVLDTSAPLDDLLAGLPDGACVGTASLRRRAQILACRPDLRVETLRGNVGTRLQKLDDGAYDAILLAAAGLVRLGHDPMHLDQRASWCLAPATFLPAAGQGALALQCRADDQPLRKILAALHHQDTADCVTAERLFLHALDGSCRTPIGAYAQLDNDEMTLTGAMWTDHAEARITHRGHRGQLSELATGLAEAVRARLTSATHHSASE